MKSEFFSTGTVKKGVLAERLLAGLLILILAACDWAPGLQLPFFASSGGQTPPAAEPNTAVARIVQATDTAPVEVGSGAPAGLPATATGKSAAPAGSQAAASDPTIEPAPGLDLGAGYRLVAEEHERFDKALNFTTRARFPRIVWSSEETSGEAGERFNQAVDAFVSGEVETMLGWLGETPLEDPGGFLHFDYQVIHAGRGLLSLRMQISSIAGGAHPATFHRSFNYDLQAGEFLELQDLFLPGAPYLERIAGLSLASLRARDQVFPDFESGAAAQPENYAVWNLAPAGLLILFEEYQVAPYAAGPQEVEIPYHELGELLDPDGPLARLAVK
jgi:hypothetical protein